MGCGWILEGKLKWLKRVWLLWYLVLCIFVWQHPWGWKPIITTIFGCLLKKCCLKKLIAPVNNHNSFAVRHGGRRPRRIVPGRRGWTGKTGVCCSLAGVRLYPGSYTSRPVIWEPRTESAARSRSCRRRGRPGQQITCGVVRVDLGHGRPKSITR